MAAALGRCLVTRNRPARRRCLATHNAPRGGGAAYPLPVWRGQCGCCLVTHNPPRLGKGGSSASFRGGSDVGGSPGRMAELSAEALREKLERRLGAEHVVGLIRAGGFN